MIELPPMPPRIAKLPRVDIMGIKQAPVPWFVQWMKNDEPCEPGDGEPDFRVMDSRKWIKAINHGNCWVCGELVGTYKAWVLGPMCIVNRTTSEPACHRDCAIWSVQACPFLTRPRQRRREKDLPDQAEQAAGFGIKRNPGVAAIWIARSFRIFRAHEGNSGWLIRLDDPTDVLWFAEGKPATREQCLESITSGYPLLLDLAKEQGADAIAELERSRDRAIVYLPAA